MRVFINLAFMSLFCAALTGCGQSKVVMDKAVSDKAETPLTVVVATDLHYLSPKLTDYGTGFMRMIGNGDGKLTQYAPELMEAFVEEVSKLHPDMVVLSGDLSFNGEKSSHIELAEKFGQLQEEGIPVLVLPGNHDINYPFSASFKDETVTRTDNITSAEFREIYGNLGYLKARARDSDSLSFLYELSDQVWFLLLDGNTEGMPGSIRDTTLRWAEEQLAEAEKHEAAVITVTHQNILPQNELLSKGFVLENHEEVAELLKTYGVTLNLSGHVHIQHIAEYEGIHDIATGSLSVSPTQYGVLSISPQGTIIYETRTVDVADWDSKKGKTAQDFAVMARECFDQCGRKKMKKELEALPIPEEQKNAMMELALEMNRNYFAGTPMRKEEVTERPAWKLWSEAGAEFFFKTYMDSMMADEGKEQNYLILDMLPAAKRL